MNCKQGDLAIVVSSKSPALGMIVVCVEPFNGPWVDIDYEEGWILDRAIPKATGSIQRTIADKHLRPIRDQDGEDEMLRIAGKPKSKERVK